MLQIRNASRTKLTLGSSITALIAALAVAATSSPGFARPLDETGGLDNIQLLDPGATKRAGAPLKGVFSTTQTDTTYFGGTFWEADSGRWEANPGSMWTFDTGNGSAMVGDLAVPYPGANPYKDPTLHAVMEGWVGWDNTLGDVPYFRRLSSSDPRWGSDVCVGALGGLGGDYSFWCGVFPEEANALCYASGQGYGNEWRACIGKVFSYVGEGIALSFTMILETEKFFDVVTVDVDTTGFGDWGRSRSYDQGRDFPEYYMPLTPGMELPVNSPGTIQIRFCFQSDGAGSDEDGLSPTRCGGFAIDNIQVTGGLIADFSDFEADANGWALLPQEPGTGGDWSNIVHLNDLPPPLTPCACDLQDSVLVFEDHIIGGHGLTQDNLAGSPWIDLQRHGKGGLPGKVLKTNVYGNLPVTNYIFAQMGAKYYPQVCPVTGILAESPWLSTGFVYYFGGVPQCTGVGEPGVEIDFSGVVPPSAEEMRIALGVVSYCRFFGQCSGLSNSSPWFDFVSLGVYGDPTVPNLATRSVNIPQDAYPENWTLSISAPGRFDSNIIKGAMTPEIGTTLGDTLVVYGGGRGPNGEGSEVYVEFEILPGPGVDPVALAAFYVGKTAGITTDPGSWYSARLDTAEINGMSTGSAWMTAYHEDDPNFSGTDSDLDPMDIGPHGGTNRLANDIFPDDLFTPGTRVHLRFRANYDTTPGASFWAPGLAQPPLEFEVMPSSMAIGSEWNCVLYVNHSGSREAADIIEPALAALLGGGANHEGTAWDRFDVNAPSSQQASWGRPLDTEYGVRGSYQAVESYNCILWNTGDLAAFTLTKEDADVLIPWMTLVDFDAQAPKSLYLSGNGLVSGVTREGASEPSAIKLLNDLLGVGFKCDTFHEANCPSGSPMDLVTCVEIDPVGGAPVAGGVRSVQHVAQGNGCPTRRSFDILTVTTPDFGTSAGDEEYDGSLKTEAYASVAADAGNAPLSFKTVVDGLSVHYRRDTDASTCTFDGTPNTAVAERLAEVLGYLRHGGGGSICTETSSGTGVDQIPSPRFQTSLSNFAPNPLIAGKSGKIAFTMAREGYASVEIFDVGGRLVKTVFNQTAERGPNEVSWNGTDETGRAVAGGVYFYRLKTDSQEFSKKMVVVRQGGR